MLRLPIQRFINLSFKSRAYFGKGKPQQKTETPAQVEPEPTNLQLMQEILSQKQYFLTFKERQYLQEGTGISPQDKLKLDKLAGIICDLDTTSYFQLHYKKESLGSSQAYFIGNEELSPQETRQCIDLLDKTK